MNMISRRHLLLAGAAAAALGAVTPALALDAEALLMARSLGDMALVEDDWVML